jgi:hypothetical protein
MVSGLGLAAQATRIKLDATSDRTVFLFRVLCFVFRVSCFVFPHGNSISVSDLLLVFSIVFSSSPIEFLTGNFYESFVRGNL